MKVIICLMSYESGRIHNSGETASPAQTDDPGEDTSNITPQARTSSRLRYEFWSALRSHAVIGSIGRRPC
jgi:hypothetical protein